MFPPTSPEFVIGSLVGLGLLGLIVVFGPQAPEEDAPVPAAKLVKVMIATQTAAPWPPLVPVGLDAPGLAPALVLGRLDATRPREPVLGADVVLPCGGRRIVFRGLAETGLMGPPRRLDPERN